MCITTLQVALHEAQIAAGQSGLAIMIDADRMQEPMRMEPLRRFIAGVRKRLDCMDPDKPPSAHGSQHHDH